MKITPPPPEQDAFDRLDQIIVEFRKLNREASKIIDRTIDQLADQPPEVYQ